VVPSVTMSFDQKFYVFPSKGSERRVRVVVESPDAPIAGRVRLQAPEEFVVQPASQEVKLAGKGAQANLEFSVGNPNRTPPPSGVFRLSFEAGDRRDSHTRVTIDHPHIPLQELFPPAEARYVATDIQRRGQAIGYVMGSGDDGPIALRQMGWDVTLLTDADLQWGDLTRFHTIVAGVRAWNTRDVLKRVSASRLAPYVFQGGTLVVQYNTAEPGLAEQMGFGRFTIGRDRVTVEEAPVRMTANDPLLSIPNLIQPSDFDGWVQERGLYFATAWDSLRFKSVLSSNDPGEPARDGGLLDQRYGEGTMIYAAYAFFRQLPACVPGAYRLFANLVSMEGPKTWNDAASRSGGAGRSSGNGRPAPSR